MLNNKMGSSIGKKELKFIHITKTAGTSIENAGKQNGIDWGRFDREYGIWHELPSRKDFRILNKYDWFLVVRNPYTRMISEFHCPHMGAGLIAKTCSPTHFNRLLRQFIRERASLPYGDHYTPQHLYLVEGVKIHVLRYETLKWEFISLMNAYGLNVELNELLNKSAKYFSTEDLDDESVSLINTIYQKDFEVFGYRVILH